MYVLSDLPPDLDKQGSPMIPPPAWFGPGITWDLPVKTVKSSGLGTVRSRGGMSGMGPMKSQRALDREKEIQRKRDLRNFLNKYEAVPAILITVAILWYVFK